MKITLRILAALMVVLTLLLVSCSPLHTVTEQGNLYYDKKTGVVYTPLSAAYEPISRGAEYATLDMGKVSYTLHEVTGLSPEMWLCSVHGDLYRAQDLTGFIAFPDWRISALYVCTNTALSVAEITLRPDNGAGAAIIASLQAALNEGTSVYYPSYATATDTYILRFESEDAPGIYYSVKLLRYGENIYEGMADADGNVVDVNVGRCFVYDRYADRCVAVDDTLFRLLDGESAEDIAP